MDHKDHQPTEADVREAERAAGLAPRSLVTKREVEKSRQAPAANGRTVGAPGVGQSRSSSSALGGDRRRPLRHVADSRTDLTAFKRSVARIK